MLRQSFDIPAINAILNDPAVLPGITDQSSIDMQGLLLSGEAIALLPEADDACYVLVECGERAFEIHTNLTVKARGRKGAVYSAKAIEWAFANTNAETLITHAGSMAVGKYAQYFGFKTVGDLPLRAFPKPCTLLRMTIHDWIDQGRASGELIAAGQKFHESVDAFRQESESDTHDEDVLHDCYAGFVVTILRHFSLEGSLKAQRIYNEWARQSGYGQITVLFVTKQETVVDIGDMVIVVTPTGFHRIK